MFRDPGVRRVVLARFISRVGGEAAFFVGIWGKAAFNLNATPGELAFVMGALGIASLIGASLAGVLVDRFDPRRVVLFGEVVFVPVAIGLVFTNTIESLAVATFLLGLVGTPVFTAVASFAPFLTDDDDRLAKINGQIEGASWAAFVVGPAAGAILAGPIGVDAIFVLDAVTSAVAAILIVPVKPRRLGADQPSGRGLAELRAGFKHSYGHPRLRFYIFLGSAVWLLFGNFSALEPLFFRDVLGAEVEALGWINSIFGVGLVAGTWIASHLPRRLRTARSLTVIVAMNAIGTDMITVVAAAAPLWGIIIGVMAPLHRTMIQINSPDEMVGRIMGVNHVHSEVGHLIPLAIAPALAAAFGVQQTLLASGLVVAVVAGFFWPAAVRLDRTREIDVPTTGLGDPADEPKTVGP